MTIELADGTLHAGRVDHVIGSESRPMSNDDLATKFRSLTDGILTPDGQARILALVAGVEELDDAATIARSTVPA